MVYNEKFQVETEHSHVTVLDVTRQVREIADRSGIKNGSILVYTGHTSCSVQIQEFSDGKTFWGTELIMQDLINCLAKIVPTCTTKECICIPIRSMCVWHSLTAMKNPNGL